MTDKARGIFLVLGLLAVTVMTAAGCGGDGNDLAQFTGTWEYTDSMATYSCPGIPDRSGLYGSTMEWNMGVSSDIVDMTTAVVDPSTKCFYGFDVKDKVATIHPGQTCVLFDLDNNLSSEQPQSWTFTLTSATTAEEVLSTSISSCSLTAMGTLKKVAASN